MKWGLAEVALAVATAVAVAVAVAVAAVVVGMTADMRRDGSPGRHHPLQASRRPGSVGLPGVQPKIRNPGRGRVTLACQMRTAIPAQQRCWCPSPSLRLRQQPSPGHRRLMRQRQTRLQAFGAPRRPPRRSEQAPHSGQELHRPGLGHPWQQIRGYRAAMTLSGVRSVAGPCRGMRRAESPWRRLRLRRRSQTQSRS